MAFPGTKALACWSFSVCLLVLVLDVSTTSAFAQQSGGRFVAVGSMTEPRAGHTATLLPDGKVLIAGGATLRDAGIASTALYERWAAGTASAELYDPSTRTFVRTGSMHWPRVGFTATLLRNGKVLIAGGFVEGKASASAELYDPAKGTFTITGTMLSPHAGHSATLLLNGKVLIVGSTQSLIGNRYPLAGAELYDPDTGRFSIPGLEPTPRELQPRAVLLKSGDVLIISAHEYGVHPGKDFLNIAELYNPKDARFSAAPSDGLGSYANGVATLLDNGNVLVSGGFDWGLFPMGFSRRARADAYDRARLYDPAHPGFQPTGRMLTGRAGHTATCLPDGQVLIAGGTSEGRRALASAELYNPDRGVFTSTADMTMHRIGQTATLLRTGEVLITGGMGDSELNNASAELYIPEGLSTAAGYTKTATNHH
jgi:hypothetical protein